MKKRLTKYVKKYHYWRKKFDLCYWHDMNQVTKWNEKTKESKSIPSLRFHSIMFRIAVIKTKLNIAFNMHQLKRITKKISY